MSIRLELEGFEELIEKIEKSIGSMDSAAEMCMKKTADAFESELKSEMKRSKVPERLINDMPKAVVEKEQNMYIARVGYDKGAYDPKNLSDGYKIVFLNYGTPKRKLHGKIKARGFIKRAKSKIRKLVKSNQEEFMEKVLGGLK